MQSNRLTYFFSQLGLAFVVFTLAGCASTANPIARAAHSSREATGIWIPDTTQLAGVLLALRENTALDTSRAELLRYNRRVASLERYPCTTTFAFVANQHVARKDIEVVVGIKHLVICDLSQSNYLHDDDVALLTSMRDLRRLEIGSAEITNEALKQLSIINALSHLRIRYNENITDSGIAHLAGLRDLQHLALECLTITGSTLALLHCANLQSLHISQCKALDSRLLVGCAFARSLQVLAIEECGYFDSNAPLRGLEEYTSLGVVELSHTYSSWYFYNPSGASLCVRYLGLSFTNVRDRDFASLGNLDRLICLNVAYSRGVSDASLKYLARHRTLAYIVLDGTTITREGLRAIAEMPSIKFVSMANCDSISNVDRMWFRAARPDVFVVG